MAHTVSYTPEDGYVIRDEQGVLVARRRSYKVVASDLMALDGIPATYAIRIATGALQEWTS